MSQKVILLAEDEPAVRQLAAFILKQEGFIVLPTCDATEALRVARSRITIDLLLADVQMEGTTGIELAEELQREIPETKVLIMSGCPDSEVMAAEKGFPFLSKPFLPNVLVGRIREVLEPRIPAQSEEAKPKQRRMVG